jgi:chemotaxis protein MotB
MPLRAPKGFIDETDPAVCQIGHPAPPWLVNYADLMTELVCFFVILYALSAALNKNIQNAAQEVKEMMKKEELKGEVKVDREGLKISLEEQGNMAFFDSGYSEITPKMREVLDKLAPTLRKLTDKQDLIIEGHTDNLPISNDYFGSNWELSTARATTVVQYLINAKGFPSNRMAAMGYGDTRPVGANDTGANRARNRRVVFFVKNAPLTAISGAPPGGPKPGAKAEVAR